MSDLELIEEAEKEKEWEAALEKYESRKSKPRVPQPTQEQDGNDEEIVDRKNMIQNVKDIAITFKMLNTDDIMTIVKNAYPKSSLPDYDIRKIINNIKTSIENYNTGLSMSQVLDIVGPMVENFDYATWNEGRKLGEGSYGVVTVAEKEGRQVAFKRILNNKVDRDFIHEIGSYAILTAIGSEYTPQLIGLSFQDNIGLAIEFATTDLYNWVESFPYPGQDGYEEGVETRKRLLPTIVDHLLESLSEIQSCEIIHRDIKPGNMLLYMQGDQVEKAVITDFGLATSFPEETASAYTPPFRSREVWYGNRASYGSDCWAFAISILYLCSRTYYYADKDDFEKKERLPNEFSNKFLKKYLREDQVEIINNMFARDPRDRCVRQVRMKVPDRDWSTPSGVSHRHLNMLLEWMYEVCKAGYRSDLNVFVLSLDLIIRFFHLKPIDKNFLQLYACVSMYIAGLWVDHILVDLERFVVVADGAFTQPQLEEAVIDTIKTLKGLIWIPGLDKPIEKLKDMPRLQQRKYISNLKNYNELFD